MKLTYLIQYFFLGVCVGGGWVGGLYIEIIKMEFGNHILAINDKNLSEMREGWGWGDACKAVDVITKNMTLFIYTNICKLSTDKMKA